jgi:hypothetical protein
MSELELACLFRAACFVLLAKTELSERLPLSKWPSLRIPSAYRFI